MLAPSPNMTFAGCPSSSTYVSDQHGVIAITNGSAADQTALQGAGCYTLLPFGGTMTTAQLTAVFNAMQEAGLFAGFMGT
jgi:hypothetical protein